MEHPRFAGSQRGIGYYLVAFTPIRRLSSGNLLKENKIFTFKGFSCYHNYATEVNGVAHGGSSILIIVMKSSTPHAQIDLHINLQAAAVRLTCH